MVKPQRIPASTRSTERLEPPLKLKRPVESGRFFFQLRPWHKRRVEKSLKTVRQLKRRPLTAGEVALGESVFGAEIDWPSVRVIQIPNLGFGAMAPFAHTIIFSQWRAREDFARAPLNEQGWFVHELAHVWQARRGVLLAAAKLRALGKRAYVYKAHPGAKLSDFNIERQAEIVRHLFLARQGAPAKEAPPRAWLEDMWAGR